MKNQPETWKVVEIYLSFYSLCIWQAGIPAFTGSNGELFHATEGSQSIYAIRGVETQIYKT